MDDPIEDAGYTSSNRGFQTRAPEPVIFHITNRTLQVLLDASRQDQQRADVTAEAEARPPAVTGNALIVLGHHDVPAPTERTAQDLARQETTGMRASLILTITYLAVAVACISIVMSAFWSHASWFLRHKPAQSALSAAGLTILLIASAHLLSGKARKKRACEDFGSRVDKRPWT